MTRSYFQPDNFSDSFCLGLIESFGLLTMCVAIDLVCLALASVGLDTDGSASTSYLGFQRTGISGESEAIVSLPLEDSSFPGIGTA